MEDKYKKIIYVAALVFLFVVLIFSCGHNKKNDKQKCRACHGSGYYEHKTCPFCNGSGYSDWDPYKYIEY